MKQRSCSTLFVVALLVAAPGFAEEVQWVRVTALLESAPGTPAGAEGNLVPGGVYSTAEVSRRGQSAIDAEILKRVRVLAGEIEAVERSMRLSRLVPRQYYLPLRIGRDAVLPAIDLNPRLGVVFTPLRVEDGQLVCRVRFLEPEGPPGTTTYTGEPITLALKEADIGDVLKVFSKVTGREIDVGEQVSGRVTVDLRKMPWDQALDVVLRTNDLGVKEDGDVLRVAPLDELSRRRRVRTEATVRLPRGGSGSATIASRGDDVNRTVVIVVESVAHEPELVAERDGLLRPPVFAVAGGKPGSGAEKDSVVVFRGTATAEGDLKDVEVLQAPSERFEASLRGALGIVFPWTVLDEQVRRIDAVVGYGLRPGPAAPAPPDLVPIRAVEHIGVELEVGPPPPGVIEDYPAHHVVSVFVRDLDSGEVISAPRIPVRRGEEGTLRASIPRPDGSPSAFELKIVIAEDGRHVSYSWTITIADTIVASHSAEFRL